MKLMNSNLWAETFKTNSTKATLNVSGFENHEELHALQISLSSSMLGVGNIFDDLVTERSYILGSLDTQFQVHQDLNLDIS